MTLPTGHDGHDGLSREGRAVPPGGRRGGRGAGRPAGGLSRRLPKGLDFGITVGSRTAEGRELFRRYFDAAITLPGPEIEQIAATSAELGIDVVLDVVERAGGTLYCASAFVTAADGHVATHRKLMPTAAERYLWGQGDGSTLSTVTTSYGIVGSAICWEDYMPLLRTAMYAQGVELWCAPTVDDREVWSATMTHIALEGRCFVLSANQFLRRSDLPDDVHPTQGDEPDRVLIGGGGMIVSPLGEVLARPLRGGEGLLTAEIDLEDITRGRFDLDVVGPAVRLSSPARRRSRWPRPQSSGSELRARPSATSMRRTSRPSQRAGATPPSGRSQAG